MRMNLLQIVQNILSDMGGDEVNSIEDTFESSQVAEIVRTTYLAMMTNRNWPHLRKMIKLTASGDPLLPTHMTLVDDVKELIDVKYECSKLGATKKDYRTIKYKQPEDFLHLTYNRNSSEANIITVLDPSGSELFIRNDIAPTYMTSFDDVTLVFDSFDILVDTTLQESKVQTLAYVMPTWEHVDDYEPDLPAIAVSALLEAAKSTSFMRVAQRADQTSALESRRQNTWLARKARRVNGGIQYPSYGRGRVKVLKDPTFKQDREGV